MLTDFFWKEYMSLYDEGVGSLAPYRELISGLVDLAELSGEERVLDAGCGTGNLVMDLLGRDISLKIVGIERDQFALDIAEKKAGNQKEASFFVKDLNSVDWKNGLGTFDVIFSCNVLYALEDPKHFLMQMSEMLNKGGKFVCTNALRPEPEKIFAAHDAWLEKSATEDERNYDQVHLKSKREKVIAMNQLIASNARQKKAHFLHREDIQSMLQEAGLQLEFFEDAAYAGVNVLFKAKR